MRISGLVKDKGTGGPLAGAKVDGSIDGQEIFETISDVEGCFQYQDQRGQFAGKTIRLRAERAGYAVGEKDYVLPTGELTVEIDLLTRQGQGIEISGIVRDCVTKQLVKDANVTAFTGDSREIFSVETDKNGSFHYEDYTGGNIGHSIGIRIEHPQYKTQETQESLGESGIRLDIAVDPKVSPPTVPPWRRHLKEWKKLGMAGVLVIGLGLVAYVISTNIQGDGNLCTETGQVSFLAASPEPAKMLEAGRACLARIDRPGQQELLGLAVRYFRSAAEAGSPEGAVSLGEMYDPNPLSENRLRQQPADYRLAFTWYLRAHNLGSAEVEQRLAALRPHIESRAEQGGDSEALSILDRWPQ